jgi:hypothetical protein
MFLLSSWSGIVLHSDNGFSRPTLHSTSNQESNWESDWIAAEPLIFSSEYGGGVSTIMKWLEAQSQIQDCTMLVCPQIDPKADEWLQRDSLTLLLTFGRQTPSLETQEELKEYGIILEKNPWRDNIDTPLLDESLRVRSFDEEFISDHIRELIESQDAPYEQKNIPLPVPNDWSLGALDAWALADMGSETSTLHAPFMGKQDYWRIGDVWFASAKPRDVVDFVSNEDWDKIGKDIPHLISMDLDLQLQIQSPLNEDRKWTGTDTQLEVGTPSAWDHTADNVALRGDQIRVADFDTGVDVFHPAFFNPSNVAQSWFDTNSNSIFEWGADGIDSNGNGQLSSDEILLRLANGDGVDSIDRDTYYLDVNGDGSHNHGPSSGFSDSTPGFGEPMYLANDLNLDGVLSPNESFMLLDQSTILATYDPESGESIRGSNLTQTAPDTNGHGTSVQGIIAGNNDKHLFSGLAPNVDLLSHDAFSGGFVHAQSWATQRNAEVMLYEVGAWTGQFLDGTSALELTLDQMADTGIVQVVCAGNLANSNKVIQGLLPDVTDPIGPVTTSFKVSAGNLPKSTWLSYLIPNGNHISFIELTKPDGSTISLSNSSSSIDLGNGDSVWISRDTSTRNTNLLNLVFSNSNGLTPGTWEVALAGPNGQGQVLFRGYEADDISSWAGGSHWLPPSPSSLASIGDNGSVTWPATADSAITIASWSSRGRYIAMGELSAFSSRGSRINDGMALVDIASPGNYDVWAPVSSQSPGAVFGSYKYFGGTSAAGPAAAATVALMLQDNPGIGHHGVWNILNSTAAWNSTTGELWNHSSRLSGAVGDPTDVVGAVLLPNGTWGLSQPYGTRLGNGIRVGDPQPGTPAPNLDWGWGYLRADRATDRDTLAPEIPIQINRTSELFQPTNFSLVVNDNSIGDGNPLLMNVSCLENQSGILTVVDYQENIPIDPLNCTFQSLGRHLISFEVTDYSNNKQNTTINVTTIFGQITEIVSSTVQPLSVTADDTFQLEARARNAWGAERPLEPQEWSNGLSPLNGFSLESSETGFANLSPVQTGNFNLPVVLDNTSFFYSINVVRGANHHAHFRTMAPSNGLGNTLFTPDEPIRFEMKWFDAKNNPGVWENYSGNEAGYVEVLENSIENFTLSSDAEADDPFLGHWNNGEFYPLRSGLLLVWLGEENSTGETVSNKLWVNIVPGEPQQLYFANLENNSVELEAGTPWNPELYAYDVANNTMLVNNYSWELFESTSDLEIAQLGLNQSKSSVTSQVILTQNIAGVHSLVANYEKSDGTVISQNLTMNISSAGPDKLVVNTSQIEVIAGESFDIEFTLYDQYDNILSPDALNFTSSPGVCNCSSDSGKWQINQSGVEYIYLEANGIQDTVKVVVSPSPMSQLELYIGNNHLLQIGTSKALQFAPTDEYNNVADFDLSSIQFIRLDEGLSLNGLEVTAVLGGYHTMSGYALNVNGEQIEFEFSILVWGDQDSDGQMDTGIVPVDGDQERLGNPTDTNPQGLILDNIEGVIFGAAALLILVLLGVMFQLSRKKNK